VWKWIIPVFALLLAGCGGPQSTLDPAGQGADQIATLFWWLAGGATIVWFVTIGLAFYAIRIDPERHSKRQIRLLVIGGGVLFPTIVLAVYLVFGLAMIPDLLGPPPDEEADITVSGEQWWWRVRYAMEDGRTVELANELRLPVDERAQLRLVSPDVIHSFWVPSLTGKVDMIPGRTNHLGLEPIKTGVYRGACAEYCGTAHTLMNFYVVVQERDAYEQWLARQAEPAAEPETRLAIRGREVFFENGCSACHAVRGTPADGVVGPDLTHVGSRLSLGAGALSNERADFMQWIARTKEVKPGVHMPAFDMLPEKDLRALATYLEGLE
jgi:cytochrome c oxidase subunit 2